LRGNVLFAGLNLVSTSYLQEKVQTNIGVTAQPIVPPVNPHPHGAIRGIATSHTSITKENEGCPTLKPQ
jgi:hypothetical protein